MPALIAVAPEKVFEPEKTSVPVPALVMPKPPPPSPTIPLRVSVPASVEIVLEAPSVIGPA
jgi:hypothetical protein